MNALGVHKGTFGVLDKVIFAVGVSFLMACSQQTASKPEETAAVPKEGASKQEPAKSAPAKTQASSLEALQN